MREAAMRVETEEARAYREAMEKIKDWQDRRSFYIEKLFLPGSKWEQELEKAKEEVPEELRAYAVSTWPSDPGEWEEEGGIPAPLRTYDAEVERIMDDYYSFIDKVTDDELFNKALSIYDASFEKDAKRSYDVAGMFLDEERKQSAAERIVEIAVQNFYRLEDPKERVFAAQAAMEHYKEVRIPPETLKALMEHLIQYAALGRTVSNNIQLRVIEDLREHFGLPESELIYCHARSRAREEIEGSIHSHAQRKKLLILAERYLALGLLRENEDKDIFDRVRDKTPYDREKDKVCERWDKEMAPLEFLSYGIEKGKQIRLDVFARFLKEKRDILSEGLRRNAYWHLRRDMFHSAQMGYGQRFKEEGVEKARGRKTFDLAKDMQLGFEFKMTDEKRYRQTAKDQRDLGRMYFSKNDFLLNDMYVRFGEKFYRGEHLAIDTIPKESVMSGRLVDADQIIEMVREIMKPDIDTKEAIGALRRVARRLKVPSGEVQKMVYAIGQFATYYKPTPLTDQDCSHEVGRCLTEPLEFSGFCRDKFDMDDVDTPHYGDSVNFYHEVNEWNGIVIDWTARQYKKFRDEPYPFIYSMDELDKIGFGELQSYRKGYDGRREREARQQDAEDGVAVD